MATIKKTGNLMLGYATIAAAYVVTAFVWLAHEAFDALDRFASYLDERMRKDD